jgi:hypothetical protein
MSRYLVLSLAAVLVCTLALAGNKDLAEASLPMSPDRIAALIDELDDAEFATRQGASEQLEAAGSGAITELEATAAAGSRESMTRALAILKKHFQTGEADVKDAARGALARLAEHRDPSAAQRARDILNPPRPVVATSRFGAPMFAPPVFVPPVGININNFRRVTVSDINGRKSVEIEERERRIRIEAPPAGNIEVEVTDKQNPAAAVRRFVAKDAAEMAKIDPEMGRLYDQHLGPREQIGGGVPPIRAGNGQRGNIAIQPVDAARLQLQTIDALLGRFRERAQTDPAAQRMVDSLEQTRARLKAVAR